MKESIEEKFNDFYKRNELELNFGYGGGFIVYDAINDCIVDSIIGATNKLREIYPDNNRYYIAYIMHPEDDPMEID